MSDGINRLFKLTLIGHRTFSDIELQALHTLEETMRIGVVAKRYGFTNVHMILADKVVMKVPMQERQMSPCAEQEKKRAKR